MKQFKKLAAALVALVMAFALVVPVSAANDNPHTITIENPNTGHTYEAYQVFTGTLSAGKLVDIEWGTGVNGDALLAGLKALETYETCTSASDVAKILSDKNITADQVDEFAEVVGKHLATVAGTSTQGEKDGDGDYQYTIPVKGDGYYLVKDKDDTVNKPNTSDAYTKYILKVVKDVSVEAKADAPSVDKDIVEGDAEVDYNNAAVGEVVNFKVTSTVPNMDGYNKYYFIVNDTLSDGLTFNNDVKVSINGTELSSDKYVVEVSNQKFNIVFKDFIQYKELAGEDIVITYSATVNENAKIGVEGNPNTVDLTYSNNPNYTYEGTDIPTGDEPVGETPDSTTITYVTKIELTKVDGADGETTLTGAQFEITGEALVKVQVTEDYYRLPEENEVGTYYELTDGTYTTTKPTDETADLYKDTTVTYVKDSRTDWKDTTKSVKAIATVDANGKLVFSGLAAGTYKITEIKAPDGFNLLKAPIEVTIGWEKPADGSTECIWTVNGVAKVENGVIQMTVANFSGAELPETGGIGTTLFYVFGSILVVGAAVLLISKKRMNAK